MRQIVLQPSGSSLRVAHQLTAMGVNPHAHLPHQATSSQPTGFLHSIGVFYQPHPMGPVSRPHQQQQQQHSRQRSAPRGRAAADSSSGAAAPTGAVPGMLSLDDWKKRAHIRNRTEVVQVRALDGRPCLNRMGHCVHTCQCEACIAWRTLCPANPARWLHSTGLACRMLFLSLL